MTASAPLHPPGVHLLADLQGAAHLDDPAALEDALLAGAAAVGARVLGAHFHRFEGTPGGVTGVLLLAESHISIHSWPEAGFAALDIFLCGGAQPRVALEAITARLRPRTCEVTEVARGHWNQASHPSL